MLRREFSGAVLRTSLSANISNSSSSISVVDGSTYPNGNNQFVIGSSSYNNGSVASEICTSTKTWSVIINGVAEKILLA